MARKTLKQHHKDRLLALLALMLLLLLLFWWLAMHNHWGPYKIKATTPTTSSVDKQAASADTASSAASAGSSGATGASGSNGSNGSSTTAPAGANTPIFNLYGSTHSGETKSEVNASSGGLSPNCVVAAKSTSTPGGKQEVCTYTQGDKVVTITYLDDNVAAVTKSGF